jgi:hypothetical protein
MSSPSDGAGSRRIVVIGAERRSVADAPAPAAAPVPVRSSPVRERPPRREVGVRSRSMQQPGWTVQRLTIAAGLGAAAVIAGALVFVAKFGGDRAAGDNPFMAIAFGLFVIGMIVFCASVIALIGTGVGVVAETRGWTPAASAVLAPLGLAWVLYLAGVVGYAIPGVLSLVLIGGLVVALK